MRKESFAYTMLVAACMCIVCSLLVSTAAVTLRPVQQRNAELDLQRNILLAAGLLKPGEKGDIDLLFKKISERQIDLRTGQFVAKETADSTGSGSTGSDSTGGGEPTDVQKVYLVERDGELQRLVLPVRGMGLWSMMHGLLALGPDLTTIESLSFYEHGETPGLGGEVDNPRWKALWVGKQAFDSEGKVRIEVIKGQVTPQTPDGQYKVDGLSGATFTARGVSNLVQSWLGDEGYGPFLDRMRKEGGL
ncbi:MAG: Na(+)-translocating NADH-quinone reductase subunit C [Patescibacteria group bacterium]|nr:Na(+)-translocating NADH-quinone reductase subunit C [Patescibacteria group bacterium]